MTATCQPASPRPYLQTRTSSGWRVLGVMIQGATLNTTVSVKMGVSGISCGNATQAAGLQANALRLLSLPFTSARRAAVVSGADAFCCATPTQFSLQFYFTPCTFLIVHMAFDSLHNIINIAHLHFQYLTSGSRTGSI